MDIAPTVPRPCGASPASGFEAAQLLRSPVWRGAGVAPGEGRPVLLIPGFLAGDGTLATMARWLRANGYWTRRAGIRANVGCSQDACERIEERLEALADRTGAKVAIVGQSRGGVLARVVADAAARPRVRHRRARRADRRPCCASTRSCCSRSALVGALGTGRVPGLFSMSCLRGACCEPFRADLLQRSRPPSATSPSTRAATGSSTGARASTARPTSSSRSAPRTAAWRSAPGAYEQVARALAAFGGPTFARAGLSGSAPATFEAGGGSASTCDVGLELVV